MDQEMNFPNPVARTDLPTKRSRWPKVFIAGGVLLLLMIVFFPQILSSKLGRKFVVSYIATRTNSAVTLESMKTSWFGGTEFRFLMIKDPLGRRISVSHLKCDASLPGLLRGNFHLGDTTVNGLFMDYVIDDGRGVDTLDRMQTKRPTPAVGAGAAVDRLPELSGKIQINNATVVLWRGTVQPKFYDIAWQHARLEKVNATFDIPSLDTAWTYTFSAEVTEEEQPSGTIASSGTVDLGENGVADAEFMNFDVTLSGTNVRAAPLGAALIPTATRDEIRQVFGSVLNKLEIAAKGSEGKIHFTRLEAEGPGARIDVKPTLDLSAMPSTLVVSSPGVISVGVCKRLAADWLVYLNPFIREAAGGQGGVTLDLESVRLPLGQRPAKTMTAKGQMTAKAVALKRLDEMSSTEALPKNVASQLALLTGDTEPVVPLDAGGRFNIANGEIAVGPMSATVGDVALSIEGTVDAESGALNLTATPVGPSLAAKIPALGSSAVAIPVTGTVRQPQMGVLSMKGSMANAAVSAVAERVNEQVNRMKSKETQRLMQKSQTQVETLLRPLQGPTTAPLPGAK